MNDHVTKNYSTDNGDTLVIGGKLVVEESATVVGLEGGGSSYTLPAATAAALGGVKLAAAQSALEGTAQLSDVITAFNGLLSALKTSGTMAAS